MDARKFVATGFLVLGLLVPALSDLHATQVVPRDLAELATDAGLVVEGRVVAQRSYWNETRTRILTEVTVDVEHAHKGRGPSRVTLLQMGGVVDGVRMTVHGALSWQTGEEVLLFLEPSLPGRHRVAGFSQGKFEIVTDERTGERWATRPSLAGTEFVGDRAQDAGGAMRLPLQRVLERAGLAIGEGR